jgi:DNA polymerase-1
VSTLYGRRRYIPELSGQNKMLKKFGERVAMNSPIQGTAADIIKVAMINVSRRLKKEGIDAHLILQVHDELVVEANKNCADLAAQILREEMENAIALPVPLSVELTVGETWYDNK